MKYLFILGRNTELSVAEIKSYLKREENPIRKSNLISNGFFIDVEREISRNTVNILGGTLAIGEVMSSGELSGLLKKLENIMIYDGTSNKLTYAVWNFSNNTEEVLDYLKKRFKKEKIKTSYKGLTGSIKMQDRKTSLRPQSKTLDREYFVFEEEAIEYFGIIKQKCDYESLEERDMKKPVRRESLAIAPRLAKIMINLSGAKPGDTLLDPFCGIGTILSEAMLQGINTVGIDLDTEAIKGARRNLKWMNFNENEYELINGDSAQVDIPKVDAMATEPDLGEIMKKIPNKERAEKTLLKFDRLMVDVLNNITPSITGKIVITTPYIRIGKKRLHCNIERICDRTDLELTQEGIPEFRYNQIVGRMIYILCKR